MVQRVRRGLRGDGGQGGAGGVGIVVIARRAVVILVVAACGADRRDRRDRLDRGHALAVHMVQRVLFDIRRVIGVGAAGAGIGRHAHRRAGGRFLYGGAAGVPDGGKLRGVVPGRGRFADRGRPDVFEHVMVRFVVRLRGRRFAGVGGRFAVRDGKALQLVAVVVQEAHGVGVLLAGHRYGQVRGDVRDLIGVARTRIRFHGQRLAVLLGHGRVLRVALGERHGEGDRVVVLHGLALILARKALAGERQRVGVGCGGDVYGHVAGHVRDRHGERAAGAALRDRRVLGGHGGDGLVVARVEADGKGIAAAVGHAHRRVLRAGAVAEHVRDGILLRLPRGGQGDVAPAVFQRGAGGQERGLGPVAAVFGDRPALELKAGLRGLGQGARALHVVIRLRLGAVVYVGDRIGDRRVVGGEALVARAALCDGDGGLRGRAVGAGPAGEAVGGLRGVLQREGRGIHLIARGIVLARGQRAAVQLVADRVGVLCPVGGKALVARAAHGHGDGGLRGRAVRAGPAREGVALLRGVLQREGRGVHIVDRGVRIAVRERAVV